MSLLVLAPLGISAAERFDDPRALLEYAYQPYATGNFPDDPYELYSPALKALFQADAERTPEGEIGAIDFDPFINAQDYELKDLAIDEPVLEGDHGTVEVHFSNFDLPQDMEFTVVDGSDGWKIDDMAYLGADGPWRLSELLDPENAAPGENELEAAE